MPTPPHPASLPAAAVADGLGLGLGPAHLKRLRALWRSAGWPCRDIVEAELIAGGWLLRDIDGAGRETLRLSDAGVHALVAATRLRRQALAAHEALVAQVARAMQRDGRVVWRGLGLRAPLPGSDAPTAEADNSAQGAGPGGAFGLTPPAEATEPRPPPRPRWVLARPDVFSVRHTTREEALAPVAHEVKVHRADLLADLRRPDKARAYAALAAECWYVLHEGIATPEEIPPEYGVLFATGAGHTLVVARPAPRRALRLPFATWMALARATPEPPLDDDAQPLLTPACS